MPVPHTEDELLHALTDTYGALTRKLQRARLPNAPGKSPVADAVQMRLLHSTGTSRGV